jgi:preprotein translocase subunit SecD
MIRRRLLLSLVLTAATAVLGVIVTVATGSTPSLGIDLQGGVAITQILDGEYPADAVEEARQLMEDNASGIGVAEPEVVIQGDAIVANLPQVENVEDAIRLLQVTGALSLRPALGSCTVVGSADEDTSATTTSSSTTTTLVPPTTTTPPPPDLISPNPTTTTVFDPSAPTTLPSVDPLSPGLFAARGGSTCQLGPEGGTGEVFERDSSAVAGTQGWEVRVNLKDGDGEDRWNALAAQCFNSQPTCPTGQLAIVLDGEVISAPSVNEPRFNGRVQITGQFSEQEARDLAETLERGALPVKFKDEPNVDNISASLGKDSLRAVTISGLIGVALVLLFVALYYRSLGLIAAAGLTVSGGLVWTVISVLSAAQGLALTLPGIAGLIVSVGVTIDSYVVFFERLKDEIRSGRTIKNSAPRAFAGAWRTIVVADIVSFLGALVLWSLTTGNVRNFAFFLGLSTLTDLFVAWFFTRPAALLLSRTKWAAGRKVMGIEAREVVPA